MKFYGLTEREGQTRGYNPLSNLNCLREGTAEERELDGAVRVLVQSLRG